MENSLRFNTTRWDLFCGLIYGIPSNRTLVITWPLIVVWRAYRDVQSVFGGIDLGEVPLTWKIHVWLQYLLSELFWVSLILLAVYAVAVFVIRKKGLACEHTLSLGEKALEEATDINQTARVYSEIRGMNCFCGFWLVRGMTGTMFVFRNDGVREGNASEFSRELNAKTEAARRPSS